MIRMHDDAFPFDFWIYFDAMLLLQLKDSCKMKNRRQVTRGGSSTSNSDAGDPKMDIKSIMKDIEFLGNFCSQVYAKRIS